MYAMGWLRLVGSIKLYVSFAEYSLFHMSLLQKIPIILSILPIEATPCLLSRDSVPSFQTFHSFFVQGGEDAQNALSCRSLSTKEPLIIVIFYGK